MATIMVVTLVACTTGCTMHITMRPEVSSDKLTNRLIPCKIVLFIDSEFKNYHWHGFSDAELRSLDYDLGSASKDLFLDALTRVSNEVTLVESRPTYADLVHEGIILVVHPSIVGFRETHSLWIRNADYYAEITYHVTAFDKSDKIILENDYSAEGVAMGGTNLYLNYAAPAERAMEQVIMTIIDEISKLKCQ